MFDSIGLVRHCKRSDRLLTRPFAIAGRSAHASPACRRSGKALDFFQRRARVDPVSDALLLREGPRYALTCDPDEFCGFERDADNRAATDGYDCLAPISNQDD